MKPACLRVPWLGPLALLVALAAATPRAATAAAPATAAAFTATTTLDGMCLKEGVGYALAVSEYVDAWAEYTVALEQGSGQTILDATQQLDRATAAVVSTGLLLLTCLVQLM